MGTWVVRTFRVAAIPLVFWSLLSSTSELLAHPGHGVTSIDPESAVHYAFEPVHGAPLLLVIAVAAILFFVFRRGSVRRR